MNQPNLTHTVQLYEKTVYKLVYNILFNTIKFKISSNEQIGSTVGGFDEAADEQNDPESHMLALLSCPCARHCISCPHKERFYSCFPYGDQ